MVVYINNNISTDCKGSQSTPSNERSANVGIIEDYFLEKHSTGQLNLTFNQDFIRKSSKPLNIFRPCPGCRETCRTKLEVYQHTVRCRRDAFVCKIEGCPFATLYGQHYEYHLKMHYGVKEIKCEQCPYTCLTKSMLRSHVRTHGIMRFRCADCTFSTKQPSQLSQHLSTMDHSAAPVLNEDGSLPTDGRQSDFKNHIRPKKRMARAKNEIVQTKRMTISEGSDDENVVCIHKITLSVDPEPSVSDKTKEPGTSEEARQTERREATESVDENLEEQTKMFDTPDVNIKSLISTAPEAIKGGDRSTEMTYVQKSFTSTFAATLKNKINDSEIPEVTCKFISTVKINLTKPTELGEMNE